MGEDFNCFVKIQNSFVVQPSEVCEAIPAAGVSSLLPSKVVVVAQPI